MTRSDAARALTDGERALAASVFGDAIDFDPVRVVNAKWWPFQPRETAMAPTGSIHFHPRGSLWSADFAHEPLHRQGLFIHEMVHVWQHQSGIFLPLRRHPFCRYGYSVHPGWPLRRYGLEQQGEIVRHVFLLRHGYTLPGAPPLAQLESILPFQPRRT
jgi:hypothetical protein